MKKRKTTIKYSGLIVTLRYDEEEQMWIGYTDDDYEVCGETVAEAEYMFQHYIDSKGIEQ